MHALWVGCGCGGEHERSRHEKGEGGGEKQTRFAVVVAVESISYLLSVVFEWVIGG